MAKALVKPTSPKKATAKPAAAKPVKPASTRTARSSSLSEARRPDFYTAPSQWGRRLARLVGDKFGVQMDANLAKNEGVYRRRNIAIKCAKSPMPPISVLQDMIDLLDDVWAVYIMPDGTAQIWSIAAADVAREGYHTLGKSGPRRIEIYLRKISQMGKLIGTLSVEEVESCDIP